MQPLRRRRTRVGLDGKQIGDRADRGRKLQIGSVDNSRCERATASHVNGLGTVMSFLAAGAAASAGLGSAQIFGARKLIPGIVDHFIGPQFGCGVGAEARNLPGKNHDDEQ